MTITWFCLLKKAVQKTNENFQKRMIHKHVTIIWFCLLKKVIQKTKLTRKTK